MSDWHDSDFDSLPPTPALIAYAKAWLTECGQWPELPDPTFLHVSPEQPHADILAEWWVGQYKISVYFTGENENYVLFGISCNQESIRCWDDATPEQAIPYLLGLKEVTPCPVPVP